MRIVREQRQAISTLEVLLTVPVLILVVAAVIEFGTMVSVNNRLANASAQGARAASQGADEKEIESAVRESLGKGALEKAEVQMKIRDEQQRRLPSGETVEVIVTIPANEAVPNLLRVIGYSLNDETLVGRTALRKE